MGRLTRTLLVAVLLITAGIGLLLWRLASGPLSLAWLETPIRALVARSSQLELTFHRPSLVWIPGQSSIGLQVEDFTARTSDGQLVASASTLRGTVLLWPLLMDQQISLE